MKESTRILLVDDEQLFCDSLAEILTSSDYSVTIALSGQEAIKLLSNNVFDILLLDVVLPDIPGYQIIESLKGENLGVPAIMLTGYASMESAIEALRQGAYDYLKKPIDHQMLFNAIDKALQHSQLMMALKISEERLRTLAEASWEGIFIYEKSLLVDANNQFYKMFGYQPGELLDQEIMGKILSAESKSELDSRNQNETFGSYNLTGVKKDGTEFPIEASSRNITYRGNEVRVCAVRDITERVRNEQEKLELQRKLAISSKMETLGMMAGAVAHDLNNILSGVVTLPEMLLAQMDNSTKHRELITLIHEAGKEAASVVSDLITVARGATAEKQICKVNSLISHYVATLQEKESDALLENIAIRLNCQPGLENIYCSVVHINKVLMNLIGNAAEAIVGGGEIIVSTKNVLLTDPLPGYEAIEAGKYVVISVTDDGPGIKQEDVTKIFEPFYSKKVMGRSGTGLGLAIVWNTVHDHGGFLDVTSGENGTTFDLYFPMTEEDAEEKQESPSIDEFSGNGETILVVDDQKNQQKIACSLLNGLGYSTVSVGSGEEAIEYIRNNSVDLIILDMIMEPGINGRKTYEEILKINPNQRALIASGFAQNGEVKQTLNLGASQFVEKPYSLLRIGMAIKQALAQP